MAICWSEVILFQVNSNFKIVAIEQGASCDLLKSRNGLSCRKLTKIFFSKYYFAPICVRQDFVSSAQSMALPIFLTHDG